MREAQHTDYPITLYYAFKQSESDASKKNIFSTGWETMLEGLLKARFMVTGTWPVRSEKIDALKKTVGALSSSIIIVCRLKPDDAPLSTRKEFIAALKRELPMALQK